MGGGFSGKNAGRGRRVLLFGLSSRPAIRERRAARPRRSSNRLAQKHGGDGCGRGSVGADGIVTAIQAAVSGGGRRLSREGEERLGFSRTRHCEVRARRRLPED